MNISEFLDSLSSAISTVVKLQRWNLQNNKKYNPKSSQVHRIYLFFLLTNIIYLIPKQVHVLF